MKRTLCITTPCHLSLSEGYLVYTHKEDKTRKECPIGELAYLILEHTHITISQALLTALAHAKVAVITCNAGHLPHALMLPLAGHYLQSERTRCQVSLTEKQKEHFWDQIIQAKIQNQVAVLKKTNKGGSTYLQRLLNKNEPNNSDAKETIAARWYWDKLFGTDFRRERYGGPPNAALNYGYALIRTATARALVCQGLILSLGFHHHNRYNPFCLVDDMMEPYRPFVDLFVWQQHQEIPYTQLLSQPERKELLSLLYQPCDTKLTLCEAIERTAISLVRTLQARCKRIAWGKIKT